MALEEVFRLHVAAQGKRSGASEFHRTHPFQAFRKHGHNQCSIEDDQKTKTLPGRLELPTLRLTASRSNQLS